MAITTTSSPNNLTGGGKNSLMKEGLETKVYNQSYKSNPFMKYANGGKCKKV